MGVTSDGCRPSWIYAVYDALALDTDYFDPSRGSHCVVLVGVNDSIFATFNFHSVV
jgi:hypothetical protein